MRKLLMLSAALLMAAPAAEAQTSPFSLEVRGRAAFPTGDFGEEEQDGSGIKTGWGGSIEGIFQATPILGLYAGYSYTRFPTDLGSVEEELEGFVDDVSVDATDAGLDAGIRATLPLTLGNGGGVFVRGGVVYHQLGVELSDDLEEFLEEFSEGLFDPDELDSEWSLGYQVGAGVLVPLGPRLSASVGATYTAYEPEFEQQGDLTVEANDVTYLSAEVGLRIRF
jgi:opacity protein-like surface antigen